jgi:hypothetical protein
MTFPEGHMLALLERPAVQAQLSAQRSRGNSADMRGYMEAFESKVYKPGMAAHAEKITALDTVTTNLTARLTTLSTTVATNNTSVSQRFERLEEAIRGAPNKRPRTRKRKES